MLYFCFMIALYQDSPFPTAQCPVKVRAYGSFWHLS